MLDWTWSFSDWIILFAVLLAVLYWLGTSNHNHFSKKNVPFIKPIPFMGNLRRNLFFPQLIIKCYNDLKDHQYGGMFFFRNPTLLIRDPELIKTITIKDFDSFTDHRTVFSELSEPIWSRGLFSLKGQRWKEMRATLSPAFTSSKMKTMFVLVSECCQQFVRYLEDSSQHPHHEGYKIEQDGDTLILELKDFYTRYTNDVIATTAFGIGVDSLKQPKNEFYMMGQDATNLGGLRIFKWIFFVMMPKVTQVLRMSVMPKKVSEFFTSLVLDTMATREREGIVRPDMLQLLMQAKRGNLHDEHSDYEVKDTKRQLDDTDIIAQALLFFLAGFDTASTLLCFTSYELAVNPEIQTRLQQEIDETLKEGGGKFTYEAVNSMKYLDMVVSETLRLYPPAAAVDRVCVRQYTLNADPPCEMSPGEALFIPIIGLHRDPEYFPDPERFDPERFSEENKAKINPLTYIPFGMGPRICIGNRFALMEVKLAVVHLLSRFTLKVVAKTPVPLKIVQKGFNMSIDGGFWLGLDKRST
ncbi:cytochrome P450 9e2-like [Periplaneta americana]|uniref:cytochrome P450 9e2-like n=1 Tax=Periplaneta americana TaxID=6978 RepID=UPI0037E81B28